MSFNLIGGGFAAAIRHATGSIRRAGAIPVFFTTATIDSIQDYFPGEPNAPVVLAFNDPEKFPILYGSDARTDTEHPNEFGAREFTRLLANRFVQERVSLR